MTEPTAQPEDLTGAWEPEPQAQVPWCCTGLGFVSECPLCPEYGTRLDNPCPGHPVDDNTQTVVDTAMLHAEFRHPGFEYRTTSGPRKQWDDIDRPPAGENCDPDYTWERNADAGRPGMGWDRFDYTEESYWRRPKPRSGAQDATGAPRSAPDAPGGELAGQDGDSAPQTPADPHTEDALDELRRLLRGANYHRQRAEAALDSVQHLADLIAAGAPWTANHDDLAQRIRDAASLDSGQTATGATEVRETP